MRRLPFALIVLLVACSDDEKGSQQVDGIPCDVDSDCRGAFPELRDCEAALCSDEGVCEIGRQPDGTECRDGLACTNPDYCLQGECTGTTVRCVDNDPCTNDSCDNKSGCLFLPASGTECDDLNACTVGDTCLSGHCESGELVEGCCRFDGECDDGDVCTDDRCDDNVCSYPFNFAPCDDGNVCTGPDHCDGAGACGGDELSCEDGNPCTLDSCNPETGACESDVSEDGVTCEDGNPCTVGDVCTGGACIPGESQCACTTDADCVALEDGDLCNGTLICSNLNCIVDPLSIVACNPTGDTTCVRNTCDPETAQCRPVPSQNGLVCNDQNPCTTADQCQNGLCLGAPLSCDDDNPCTFDACSPVDGCQYSLNNLSCSDGSACTVNDQCNGGVCLGVADNCDDNNPCTDDGCDDITGCIHTPNDDPCDIDPCTSDDFCAEGVCKQGTTSVCVPCETDPDCVQFDDGNFCNGILVCVDSGCVADPTSVVSCDTSGDTTCSKNRCTPATGQCEPVFTADGTPCSDGSSCTLLDQCDGGVCTGTAVDCDDNNPCTNDSCNGATGCVNTPNTASCSDNNACTSNDVCNNGSCSGSQILCDDGNECTIDSCDPAIGCRATNAPVSTVCNDQSDCTSNDHCENGSCTGTGLVCNDGNECTLDQCDPVTGCSFPNAPSSQTCNDGSACTTADHCSSGSCVGDAITCDDGNACTTDGCNPASGCTTQNVANNNPCDDGDSCTDPDTCQNGVCTPGADICIGCNTTPCPDPGQCKTATCDTDTGDCIITNNTGGSCNDNNACTTVDTCQNGTCTGSTPPNCDDTNPCTTDGCAPASGCTHTNVTNGTTCPDADLCDGTETCTNGVCSTAGTALTCNDNKPCTDDTCIPATGCSFVNDNTNTCADTDLCDGTETCSGGACVAGTPKNCNDNNACTTDSCDSVTGLCSNQPPGICGPLTVSCGGGTATTTSDNGLFTPVLLDATLTSSGSGGATYQWVVTSRPTGSTAQPTTPTSVDTYFTPDVAGTYVVTLTVTDSEGQTATCNYTVTAVPGEELRIELVWDEAFGDADLHLAHPSANLPSNWYSSLDCYFGNCASGNGLPWGANGPPGNPTLDIDDTDGSGPENINIDTDPVDGTYTIAVSYYCEDSIVGKGGNATYVDGGPSTGVVRIHCNGTTTEITNLNLDQTGRFIVVGRVTWPTCAVQSVKTSSFVGDVQVGPGNPARCQRACADDNDCLSGEYCYLETACLLETP